MKCRRCKKRKAEQGKRTCSACNKCVNCDQPHLPGRKVCAECAKLCSRCFKNPRAEKGPGSWCLSCNAANSKRWRDNNPERAREVQRNYNQTPGHKKAKREYDDRAIALDHDEKERLSADIPVEVIRPFVERMQRELTTPMDSPARGIGTTEGVDEGQSALSKACGVSEKILRQITEGTVKGITMGTADKLSLYGDFSLPEIYERAEEWALLTGNDWPIGYRTCDKSEKAQRRMSNTRYQVMSELAIGGTVNEIVRRTYPPMKTAAVRRHVKILVQRKLAQVVRPPHDGKQTVYGLTPIGAETLQQEKPPERSKNHGAKKPEKWIEELILLLRDGPKTLAFIAEVTLASEKTARKYLGVLQMDGLVTIEPRTLPAGKGRIHYYRLTVLGEERSDTFAGSLTTV